jgi:hypothetical protein
MSSLSPALVKLPFRQQPAEAVYTVNFFCVNKWCRYPGQPEIRRLQKGVATMTFQIRSRRLILFSGFALAVAAAPAVAAVIVPASNTPIAECPAGEVMDPETSVCMPGAEANTPAAIPGNPNLPAVDGIPCTGANTGECIGLQESGGGGGEVPMP